MSPPRQLFLAVSCASIGTSFHKAIERKQGKCKEKAHQPQMHSSLTTPCADKRWLPCAAAPRHGLSAIHGKPFSSAPVGFNPYPSLGILKGVFLVIQLHHDTP
jgi:hypothetical protein